MITFVKRSSLPISVKGKASTLSVCVTKNGQLQLSKLSTNYFGGMKKLFVGFEAGKVYLFRTDAKSVAKADQKEAFDLHYAKKGSGSMIGGAALLRDTATFGTHLYDFAASGNQTFQCSEDTKNGCLVFDLPAGKLTPRPVTKRVKKVVAPATKANPGETNGVPVSADDLILDAA